MPVGPGARTLIAAFQHVDAELAKLDAGPATVVPTDRHVELLLKKRAATLHIQPANYCWFTDPAKALCLKLRRHADRRPAAGRNVRRSPLPAGHLPPRAPRGLGRLRHDDRGFSRQPPHPRGREEAPGRRARPCQQVVAAIDQAAAKERQ